MYAGNKKFHETTVGMMPMYLGQETQAKSSKKATPRNELSEPSIFYRKQRSKDVSTMFTTNAGLVIRQMDWKTHSGNTWWTVGHDIAVATTLSWN